VWTARPLHIVYGGTFDPVHRGHVAIARAAREALLAEGLGVRAFDFLPNADPPHRAPPGAAAGHRVAMLWLALAGESGFGIDLRELRRGGASYMVDTLEALRGELGRDAPLVLLLGEDAWRGFDRWQRWQAIPQLAHLLVVDRPHADIAAASPALEAMAHERTQPLARLAEAPCGGLSRLSLPPEPASATDVRAAVAQGDGRAIEAYLEPSVAAYIKRHGLYGRHASGST